MSDFDQLAYNLRKPLASFLLAYETFVEAGTFAPSWVGSGTAGTFTYTANATLIEWQRLGSLLFFNGRIVITAIGTPPTGNLLLAGFPYAAVADATMLIAGGADCLFWSANVAAGYTQVAMQISNTGQSMNVLKSGDNLAPTTLLASELIVGDWRVKGHYRIA
jgi:hypothetical protein